MSLEGLTEQEIRKLEQQLLSLIPQDGSTVGNVSLQRNLNWEESLYWSIRNRLLDHGLIETGRGKGGSVRRIDSSEAIPTAEVSTQVAGTSASLQEAKKRLAEDELYEPMAQVIRQAWAKDNRYERVLVEIIARQGRRQTGGRWSRPDIVAATYTTYFYVPGRHFDVITFEVKPQDAVDITALYEALSHLRAASKAYVIFHSPEKEQDSYTETLAEIVTQARQHGIGLIVASDPADYESWDEQVEAIRCEPDPAKLNEFLANQISDGFKEQVVKWFR